jgi:hypothetical protein
MTLSNPKLKAVRDPRVTTARHQQRDSVDALATWRSRPPRDGESLRWESVDGRWVSITLGHGATAGTMLVVDSAGRCESADSYESAVALARSWCT